MAEKSVIDALRDYEATIPNESKPPVVAAIKELERLNNIESELKDQKNKEHLAQNKKPKKEEE